MITIKYDRIQNNTIILCKEMSCIEQLQPLKIKLKNIITGEIHFEVELYSGTWATWVGAELITDILIYSKNDKLLKEFKWDVTQYGDQVEKTLYYYHLGRIVEGKFSKGLVIGTHDGRNGHWIYSIKDGLSQATLVEGSEKQFEKLKANYKDFTNVRLVNQIVTTDGSDVDWYQGGEGYTDTVVPELIHDWLDESKITKIKRQSISINEIMRSDNFDWVHLDVEGIDAKLILAMEQRPNIIVYESMNLSDEDNKSLDIWFEENLYTKVVDNGNTIAIKKQK